MDATHRREDISKAATEVAGTSENWRDLTKQELIVELATLREAYRELLADHDALSFENVRLYNESQEAVRSRDELLAVVAHDLGNPLNAILLCTARMAPAKLDTERRKTGKQVEIIRRAAVRMNRLVDDLHTVAAIENGYFTIETHPVRLNKLIESAVLELQQSAEARGIELEHDVIGERAMVVCDRERMLQVFVNLIGNALKFTSTGGRIVVRAETVGSKARFEVSDTGAGIDERQLPLVFERHFRGGSGRRGRGLGLYIVKGIVEAHGGAIWAESALGAGTSFFFTLPLAQSNAYPISDL